MNFSSSLAPFAITGCLLTTAEWVNPIELRSTVPVGSTGATRTREDWPWFFVYLAYAPLVGAGTVWLADTISRRRNLARIVADFPLPVRMIGCVLVCELGAYCLHRLMHRVPLLWRVHAVHPGSHNQCWYTAFRFHPIDG